MKDRARDKYLIFKVTKGDSDAFGKIYEIYIDKIYRFIFYKVSSKETAEDISSQVFYKLLLIIRDEEIRNLQAFLYQIARNLVIDHYRQNNQKFDLSLDEVAPVEAEIGSDKEIIKLIDDKADFEKVKQSLSEMKEIYRDVIIWHYLEGFQAQEIADFIDKTPGATRVIIHRALKQLQDKLK